VYALIRAEMAYNKWSIISTVLFPLGLVALIQTTGILPELSEEDGNPVWVMLGFWTALFYVQRISHLTHQTNLAENRIAMFATLPVAHRSIALSQSVPFLIITGTITVMGFSVVGLMTNGFRGFSLLELVNWTLFAIVFGLADIFSRELTTVVSRWKRFMIRASILLLIVSAYLAVHFAVPIHHRSWVLSVGYIALGSGFFLGHMTLFTRFRDDLSTRSKKP